MLNRRVLLSVLVAIAVIAGGGAANAKNHKHHDGHALLDSKMHQNGKHEVGKIGNNTVTAEINNNKVTRMSAGSLPVKKVRSKQKMAGIRSRIMPAAYNGELKLAQADAYYYGYCFDTPDAEECYWYPADDVIVTDGWVDYVAG